MSLALAKQGKWFFRQNLNVELYLTFVFKFTFDYLDQIGFNSFNNWLDAGKSKESLKGVTRSLLAIGGSVL